MADQVIPVSLSLTGEAATAGHATLRKRARATRLARAGLILIILWAISAASIILVGAHWVTIPGFAAAGVVMAVVRLLDDVSLMTANGICPRCKAQRTFQGAGRFRPGRTVHCDGCGSQIAVHPS